MVYVKKLVVENFQSHERTELELSPGLNVIVGPSDYGKSALVRALRWLFYNEPKGADFVRVGARSCRVSAELSNGVRLERVRDGRGNRYIVERPGKGALPLQGFGTEVPEEVVAATGVRKVALDERTRLEVNVAAQIEGPFLLAENGAVRAKVIGQLGGVHIIDYAHRGVLTDLRRAREEEARLAGEVARLEEELKEYDFLPSLEERLSRLAALLERAGQVVGEEDALQELFSQWEEVARELGRLGAVLEVLAVVEEAEAKLSLLEEKFREYQELAALRSALEEVGVRLRLLERVLDATSGVAVLEERLTALEERAREVVLLSELGRELESVELLLGRAGAVAAQTAAVGRAEELVEGAEARLRALRELGELAREAREHERSYQGALAALARYEEEGEKLRAEFRRVLEALGRCPFCFGDLSPGAVARVLEEYS